MANYLNIFFGVLTLLGSSVMAYGLWVPVMDFLDYFPIQLYIMVGALWAAILFFAIAYMPFIMMVSDDKGQ